MAVVVTLSKGYDLDYVWKQVDRGPVKDAASYYIQASESGGEPPGRWWGPGAKALGFDHGQRVEREPYNLLFGERKAPDGTRLGRPPGPGGRPGHRATPVDRPTLRVQFFQGCRTGLRGHRPRCPEPPRDRRASRDRRHRGPPARLCRA